MNETEIIRQMQLGNMEAFDQVFEIYKNRLFRMAFLISGNYADSEDIVQETFVKCYLKRRDLKDISSFTNWLYQILTHIAWRYCNKQKREQPVDEIFDQNLPSSDPQPLEHCILHEEQKLLYQKIEELELRQKTVIILYYFNQLSTKEIAKIMGCREGTVKSRLHTARKNLQMSISDRQETEESTWTNENLIL